MRDDADIDESNVWRADSYAQNVRFVSRLTGDIVDMLAPMAEERILDLGCGDGDLTIRLADSGASMMAVDASQSMVDAARAKGLEALRRDARDLGFDEEFDAVFSNAALHWVQPPEEAIGSIARALKPGGRFVAEFGGFGNVAAVRTALYAALSGLGLDGETYDPWFFPTPEYYASLLTKGGFTVQKIELVPRLTPVPAGMVPWLETFAGPFMTDVGDPAEVLGQVADLLKPALCDEAGHWHVDYVRLRVRAVKG